MGQPADPRACRRCLLRLSQQPDEDAVVREGRAAFVVADEPRGQRQSCVELLRVEPPARTESRRAAEAVERGSMPPAYYTWFGLHSNAKLSSTQRAALVAGLIKSLGLPPVSTSTSKHASPAVASGGG